VDILALSVMILLVVIASVCSWYFMSIVSLSDEEKSSKFSLKLLAKSKKSIKLYIAFMFISGLALSLGLLMLYPGHPAYLSIQTLALYLLLVPTAWYDFKYMKIPNKIILTGIAVRFLFYAVNLFVDAESFFVAVKSDIVACLLIGGILLILRVLFKTGIGYGDIKLLLMMSFFQGVEAAVSSLFISLLIAWFYAIFLLITRKKSRKDTIPFAPLILIGTYISMWLVGA